MMSIVVMRQKVESAVDKQTPSEGRYPLRMQQIIPNAQHNQNKRDSVENIKEILPRLHKVSGTPHFTLWRFKDKRFDCEEDE